MSELTHLRLMGGQLSGEVKWNELPKNLVRLNLWDNKFSTISDAKDLPRNLKYLGLTTNSFNKDDLEKLKEEKPEGLEFEC